MSGGFAMPRCAAVGGDPLQAPLTRHSLETGLPAPEAAPPASRSLAVNRLHRK